MTKKQGRGNRLKYAASIAGFAALGGVPLSACDGAWDTAEPTSDAQYGLVCVSHDSGNRVEDDQCPDDRIGDDGFYDSGPHGTYATWYPVISTYDVPPVGGHVNNTPPLRVAKGASIARGVPATGVSAKSGGMSSISRGGLGRTGSGAAAGKAGGSGGS